MMGNTPPRVSVLMTAYNRSEFIGSAIDSVLASDFSDFELIIIDDDSKDTTVEIARDYQARDSRVKVYVNPENLGDYLNRNRAALLAQGRYLKYVDSDDMVYPWTLSVMLRCLERFPDAGLGLAALPEEGQPHPIRYEPRDAYLRHFLKRDLFSRAPGSALICKHAFDSVGGFSGLRHVGDLEFWLKICARFPLVTLPHGLTWDRVHTDQEKNHYTVTERTAMNIRVTLAALADPACPLDQSELAAVYKTLADVHERRFWKIIAKPHNLRDAITYRRAVLDPVRRKMKAFRTTGLATA